MPNDGIIVRGQMIYELSAPNKKRTRGIAEISACTLTQNTTPFHSEFVLVYNLRPVSQVPNDIRAQYLKIVMLDRDHRKAGSCAMVYDAIELQFMGMTLEAASKAPLFIVE